MKNSKFLGILCLLLLSNFIVRFLLTGTPALAEIPLVIFRFLTGRISTW